MPSRSDGSGWVVISEGWERSGSPPGGPGVARRPTQRTGSGLEGREWSGGHHEGLGVVETPPRSARSGQEALPKGWE